MTGLTPGHQFGHYLGGRARRQRRQMEAVGVFHHVAAAGALVIEINLSQVEFALQFVSQRKIEVIARSKPARCRQANEDDPATAGLQSFDLRPQLLLGRRSSRRT